MAEFLNMGGHGHFVWPAYLVSALVLGAMAAAIRARTKSLARRAKEHEQRNS